MLISWYHRAEGVVHYRVIHGKVSENKPIFWVLMSFEIGYGIKSKIVYYYKWVIWLPNFGIGLRWSYILSCDNSMMLKLSYIFWTKTIQPWKHAESHIKFKNSSQKFLKYWLTLWHFVMNDPVCCTKNAQHSEIFGHFLITVLDIN